MKRFRKMYGSGIRFYLCGEYGEKFGRPHYHACLFNHDFPDKVLWKIVNNQRLYISESLSRLWPYGYSTIGSLTFESAAYVARYIMKKQTGERAAAHYEYIDEDGVVHDRKPEYCVPSRNGGIGKGWLEKFKSDVYPHDFVIINGRKVKPPKFYDAIYEVENPNEFAKIKQVRVSKSKRNASNNTSDRLKVREKVLKKRLTLLPRNTE